MFWETRGAGFNIDAKTMAIWSLAPPHEKSSLMEIKETPQGNAIFWNVHSTISDQIYTLLQSSTLLGKSKIDVLQGQLEEAYDRYVEARRLYDTEARKAYVLQEENKKLEDEIAALKSNARPIIEVRDQEVQIDPMIIETQEEGVSAEQMDIEVLEEKKEIEINTMKGLLIHRIDILKRISQNVHSTFLSLQGTKF